MKIPKSKSLVFTAKAFLKSERMKKGFLQIAILAKLEIYFTSPTNPLPRIRLERQMASGEDCHNRLSALALSEVGEDACGLYSAEKLGFSSTILPSFWRRPESRPLKT